MRTGYDVDDRLTPTEATMRFAGVVLLAAVGYIHLLDLSHKVDEGIWYMVLAFLSLIGAAIVISVGLVRASATQVRLAWLGAALISLGALGGYVFSRMIPLPGMADHQGDWINAYGVLAALAETLLVALAAYAMRDLTLRGVPHRPPAWLRVPAAGLAPPTMIMLTLLLALPSRAVAHGGEDDEAAAEAATAPGRGEGKAEQAAPAATEGGGGAHGDPFLGSGELTIALLACAGLVAWAAYELRGRVQLRPVR